MKKLLISLISILISVNSYAKVELNFSSDTFCELSPKVQVRNNLYYLPNQTKPYSGANLCIYLSNGQYHNKGKMKNGLRDGVWSFWHENGQIEQKINYKNGALDGKFTEWYENNGQIEREVNFKDDELDGKWTAWYQNGRKESESNYKDGKKDGRDTWWYDNDKAKLLETIIK